MIGTVRWEGRGGSAVRELNSCGQPQRKLGAGGATFAVAGSEFTLGGIYAFGSEPTSASIDLIPDDAVDDSIVELRQELENTFRRITFILGFTISFE